MNLTHGDLIQHKYSKEQFKFIEWDTNLRGFATIEDYKGETKEIWWKSFNLLYEKVGR
ncbi:MAG: hypothetical protein ACRDD8_06855 [Bacteroidales bacterium]